MGMSQKEIATTLSRHPTLIAKHFSGDATVKAEDLEEYARLLSCSPEELLKGTYEWTDPEYQVFTMHIPRHESLEKMRNKEAATVPPESKEAGPFSDPTLKGIFLGTTIASIAGLAVNIFANKHAKKDQNKS